ncbi:hypothetical protein DU508_12760 [Pedobacter chinensis]|uniref:Uncharacterized protein n=1 Tax=Pedobacter chinensis TaxID=2282421 RepID=A0A369PZQ5_9SPHI|nr:hypothetical protein DU508_12760 [Pedobacter chinensis]
MKRRILLNIILAYMILPFIIMIRDYIQIDLQHDQAKYAGTFIEYVKSNILMLVFILPTLFLIFILTPYNSIILWLNVKRIWSKILYFELVLIVVFCLCGTFMNVWIYPYWKNVYYLFYFLPISLAFATPLHFLADKNDKI